MKMLRDFYTRGRITFIYILLFPILLILSFVYIFCVCLIKFFYKSGLLRQFKSSSPVISVGNITLGGSGKTPLVEYLASRITKDARQAAVLLRGYKRPHNSDSLGTGEYRTLGDEAGMLKGNLPESVLVLAGSDRSKLAEEVDKSGKKRIIVLDDGFQHWRLKRDLDIVAVDARNPFGNRFVVPAGILREGISSLRRAQLFCLTHCDETKAEDILRLEAELSKINPGAPVIEAAHSPRGFYNFPDTKLQEVSIIKGRKVWVLCGIANPSSFINLIEKLGGVIAGKSIFDDHHHYTIAEIGEVEKSCRRSGAKSVVTTQKDAQRLSGAGFFKKDVSLLVLRISLEMIKGERILNERLSSLYYT